MYLLCDGERECVPFLVAFLLVRGNGVMNHRLHPVVCQVLLQLIAVGAADGEEVEHMRLPVRHLGQDDGGVLDVFHIVTGHGAAFFGVFVQVLELHIQHSGLDFIQSAVAPGILEHVFLCGTVVSQSPDAGCQLIILAGHGTAIAQSSQVFAGVEAVARGIADAAGARTALEAAAVCLGIVFYQLQVVLAAKLTNLVGVGALTIEAEGIR